MEIICCGDRRLNDGGEGGSSTAKKLVDGGGGGCGSDGMKLLNDDGGSGRGGCGSDRMKLLIDGSNGGGDKSLLLFLLKLRLSFFSASNLLYMSISTPGRGAFPTRSLVTSFLPMPSSLNKDPTTEFGASKVEMS